MPQIKAVLFDLDGTVADTAPDLAYAANSLRLADGVPPLPVEILRPLASQGARGLLKEAVGLTPDDPGFEHARLHFLSFYENNLCVHTRLFAGISQLLEGIEARGLPWGIVTNKVEFFAQPLMQQLGLAERCAITVGGDTTPNHKPAPDPLLHAAQAINVAPEACLYVGDDLRDVQAAHAAGMTSVAVRWGYLGDGPPIEQWNAHHIVKTPKDLHDLLETLC
ncbi:MAG: phosphoglycolate phosphatase [Fluviibacter phosphoraccumulans EoVTN8]